MFELYSSNFFFVVAAHHDKKIKNKALLTVLSRVYINKTNLFLQSFSIPIMASEQKQEAHPSNQILRVATLNILWPGDIDADEFLQTRGRDAAQMLPLCYLGARIADIARVFKQRELDVCLIQEVHVSYIPQLQMLGEKLDLTFVFSRIYNELRQTVLAVGYKSHVLEHVSDSSLEFDDEPFSNLQHVALRHLRSQKSVHVINAHIPLDRNFVVGESDPMFSRRMIMTRHAVEETQKLCEKKDEVVILGGDFNTLPSHNGIDRGGRLQRAMLHTAAELSFAKWELVGVPQEHAATAKGTYFGFIHEPKEAFREFNSSGTFDYLGIGNADFVGRPTAEFHALQDAEEGAGKYPISDHLLCVADVQL